MDYKQNYTELRSCVEAVANRSWRRGGLVGHSDIGMVEDTLRRIDKSIEQPPPTTLLRWTPGPAEGGGGSAGKDSHGHPLWWDGDYIIAIVELADGGRDVFLASVSCDDEYFELLNPLTSDIITEWSADDISWFAVLEHGQLPPKLSQES